MRRRLIRSVAETPFEVMVALLSVYAGAINLVYGRGTPDVPLSLLRAVASEIIVGGVIVLAARVLRGQRMNLERAGLALLVCAYWLFTFWGLWRLGISMRSVASVAADFAIGAACAIRMRVLSCALRLTRERP